MTDLTRILKLDADQIHELLMNHELFPVEMVKSAARRKVELDKCDEYEWPLLYQRAMQQYSQRLAHQSQGMPYSQPPHIVQSSLLDSLFGPGLL